jgi:hypothetical protein
VFVDRGTASVAAGAPATLSGDSSIGPPGSPDKLNLVGRPSDVAAELDRLAQSASARLNPPPLAASNADNTASEC